MTTTGVGVVCRARRGLHSYLGFWRRCLRRINRVGRAAGAKRYRHECQAKSEDMSALYERAYYATDDIHHRPPLFAAKDTLALTHQQDYTGQADAHNREEEARA
jgi:hypothetical protein